MEVFFARCIKSVDFIIRIVTLCLLQEFKLIWFIFLFMWLTFDMLARQQWVKCPYFYISCTGNGRLGMWTQVYALYHHISYRCLGLILAYSAVYYTNSASASFLEVWYNLVWGGNFVFPNSVALVAGAAGWCCCYHLGLTICTCCCTGVATSHTLGLPLLVLHPW